MKNQKTQDITEKQQEKKRNEEKYRQNEAFAEEALSAFLKHYPPAYTIAEAVRFFTSKEIADTVKDIYPTATVDDYTLSLFLKTAGYSYAPMNDQFNISFKWMTK
jgi:type III secretory pathway component EscR